MYKYDEKDQKNVMPIEERSKILKRREEEIGVSRYKEFYDSRSVEKWVNKIGKEVVFNSPRSYHGWRILEKRLIKEGPVFGFNTRFKYLYNDFGNNVEKELKNFKEVLYKDSPLFPGDEHYDRPDYIVIEQEYLIEDKKIIKLTKKWLKLFKYRISITLSIIMGISVYVIYNFFLALSDLDSTGANLLFPKVLISPVIFIFWIISVIKCVIRKSIVKKAKKRWKQLK